MWWWRARRSHGGGPIPEFARRVVERPAIGLTADWVRSAVGGRIARGEAGRKFSGVSVETRTLEPEARSGAIRGERFDGAAFGNQAVAAGAAGIVVPPGRGEGVGPTTVVIE